MTAGKTSRRGFLATLGAAGVAAAVPVSVHAGVPPRPAAREAYLAAWRAAYLEELEELALSLEPRFRAGDLYSFRDNDDEGQRRIEDAAARHFNLGAGEDEWDRADTGTARLILAASPHADATGDGACYPGDHAREAVAWDLLAIGRARGWYTPTADECPDPAEA